VTIRQFILLVGGALLIAAATTAFILHARESEALHSSKGDEHAREVAEKRLEQTGIENPKELARLNASLAARIGAESSHQLSDAVRQKARLAQANRQSPIAGTGGSWRPYGTTPLIFDDPAYPAANGDGFGKVNGRINELAYAPTTKTLYAAVAQGGVWKSADLGKRWTPIGDRLPVGSTGSVTWTPAGGGTLIVATGDHAFSNDYAGVGVFTSTDDGRSWQKAAGAPDGALSFHLEVDPTNPSTIYYASGLGLFRSTDAGRSFTNVKLPTAECAGDSSKPSCFFANIVTDVVVQPKDKFGHNGGAVLATVGWRAGRRPNFAGKPESPANGLYRSDTGAPGSFQQVPDSAGFTPSARAGRAELAVAHGPEQNSGYVYAIVQDAELFNNQVSGGENDVPLVGTPSVLDAIYVSGDFGKSWQVMESRQEFFNPANGSALAQLTPLGIGPGYQVTYNQWIEPDPTRQVNGVPTRVLLGMEEVWQTATTQGVPQSGHSEFHVFGQYTANGGACLAVPEQCGAKQEVAGNTTTHPDQHGSILVPDENGGQTLVVGNDGGAYTQHVDANGEFNQLSWGEGANEGFHTLLPYGVAMAKDGVAWAGLQDNGQLKITPDGKQFATYVGDGIFALVDPDNSKIAYDELPLAGINVTKDGGTTWTDIAPTLTSPDFVAPMVMDPKDPRHIMTMGREIVDKRDGPDSGKWTTLYDLGTRSHPGDATAKATQDDPNNHGTAAQVIGNDAVVGFCGSCDPVKLKQRFHNGIATSVGGKWHVAAAKGLPNRFVTSVAMEPADHRTLYVTLGASAARYWAPLGSQGENAADAAGGYVYKSTDAGETFTDITGDLPRVQATWVVPRGGQLIVSDAIGVFASSDKAGTRWAPLGDDLPPVATYSFQLKPGSSNTLVAATYGRGVYTYDFRDATRGSAGAPCSTATRPSVRVATRARTAARARRLRLRGTSKATRCPRPAKVARVQVAVQKVAGRKCRNLRSAKTRKLTRAGRCSKRRWLRARGTRTWRFTVTRRLARGRYRVFVRAVDAAGNRSKPRRIRVRVR
jgi:hypothetical protein